METCRGYDSTGTVKPRACTDQDKISSVSLSASSTDEKFTYFFGKDSPFSQGYPANFNVDNTNYNSAGQFMMHKKAILFNDLETANEILATENHYTIKHKSLGRKVRNFDGIIWKRHREEIVRKGTLEKFRQNPHLLKELVLTRGTTLVEASPYDRIWGIGLEASNPEAHCRTTWRGANLLGKILTEVREELMMSCESVNGMLTPSIHNSCHSGESGEKFTFFTDKESIFSQWHPVRFKVDGIEFNCAEQFMMYQKAILFNDHEIARKIMATDEPSQHQALGRAVRNFDRIVWKKNRREIVKRGNMAKFQQNPTFMKELISTHGTTLVEAYAHDKIWSIGLDPSDPKIRNRALWQGTNLVGEILTEVREELMASELL